MTPKSSSIARHTTHAVAVGPVFVGGNAPIVVQSMTNTDTADVKATVEQVAALARAGSELVRITVNTEEAALAVPAIREGLDARGVDVPLVGDFHFNGHRLLASHPRAFSASSPSWASFRLSASSRPTITFRFQASRK